MERCCGQAAMVHADHANSWWGVELLIPLLKHIKYYYFCVKSMCRPMPTRGKVSRMIDSCGFGVTEGHTSQTCPQHLRKPDQDGMRQHEEPPQNPRCDG